MRSKLSPIVFEALSAAGWYSGRHIDTASYNIPGLELFTAAQNVLQEFGGLHIGKIGPGKECATSDIDIDPTSAGHISDELARYGETMGTQLFPLGEIHHGHGILLIDADGGIHLLNDDLTPYAPSFVDALQKCILGLLPDRQH